jgi:hypothetical protein
MEAARNYAALIKVDRAFTGVSRFRHVPILGEGA